MPAILVTLFADNSSVKSLIIGVPAQTEDSNKTLTLFKFAFSNISSP